MVNVSLPVQPSVYVLLGDRTGGGKRSSRQKLNKNTYKILIGVKSKTIWTRNFCQTQGLSTRTRQILQICYL